MDVVLSGIERQVLNHIAYIRANAPKDSGLQITYSDHHAYHAVWTALNMGEYEENIREIQSAPVSQDTKTQQAFSKQQLVDTMLREESTFSLPKAVRKYLVRAIREVLEKNLIGGSYSPAESRALSSAARKLGLDWSIEQDDPD